MTVSENSEMILNDNFSIDLSHSEGIDSAPSDENNLDYNDAQFTDESDGFNHYGILGMKWGVRRTKEELGYRTKKRKRRDLRYEDETAQQHQARLQRESNERAVKTQAAAQTKSEKRQLKAKADEQKRMLKSQERQQERTIKSQEKARRDQMKQQERQRKEQEKAQRKKTKSNLDKGKKRQDPKTMTDQEIRDAIARMQLEKQYKQMSRGIGGKAASTASEIFSGAGKKIVTALIVTYGTKAATAFIDSKIKKKEEE